MPDLNTSYVGADHFNASYQSIQRFINQGKKNIALVTTDINVEQIIERYDGYKKALEDNGIKYDGSLVLKIHFNQEERETIAQIKELFGNEKNDAVLLVINYLIISGLKVLKQINKKVGDDFAVIAYNDHEAFELHTPSISAVQ
ncbi:LacI family transcriptional regulator [Pedobacter psychrodurus]|uniref:LacI family transcriptional regulator n=1 Tax=Pedobacter psychrodurus TaxID=2530456 RepID=A0A4R0PMX9_9SPHI|nr:LacI family transcriptional regulator [Pedobacter psychrodurus]